jgi:hypothetical protein
MSVYMSGNVGPTLTGLISKAASLGASRFNLDDEIDLARSLTIRAVQYWNLALESGDKTTDDTRIQCERLVAATVENVVKTVAAAVKTKMLQDGALQLDSVEWVVAEMTKAIDEEIRTASPELADRLTKRIGEIKLPEDGKLSGLITAASSEEFL